MNARRPVVAVAVTAIVIALAFVAVLALSAQRAAAPLGSRAARVACGAAGSGVAGQLRTQRVRAERAVVQIMPASPYGRAYLAAARVRLGMAAKMSGVLSLTQLQRMQAVIRYASIDRRGRFACRGLAPGQYVAIAATIDANSHFAFASARFDIARGKPTLVSLTRERLVPLR